MYLNILDKVKLKCEYFILSMGDIGDRVEHI